MSTTYCKYKPSTFRSPFVHLKLLFLLFNVSIGEKSLAVNLSLMDNSNLTFNRKNVTKLLFAWLDAYPSIIIVLKRMS